MIDSTIGIYVHIPFCKSICPYCDFDRQAHGFERIPRYLEALVTDIQRAMPHTAHSVFFGGGTPSLLTGTQVGSILDACRESIGVADDAEITLEANPGDLTVDLVEEYVSAGVNRMSLGVQSFDDATLQMLGRRHVGDEARHAFRTIRAGGIQNASLDLMYGLPGMDSDHWRRTLDSALELEPDHLSCYLLTVDERVPMGRDVMAGRLSLPADEQTEVQYRDTMQRLAEAGYEHYEISNWALPGRASRHNLTYWLDQPYLAFGSGAAGSYNGRRWKNHPSPDRYMDTIKDDGQPAHIEDETMDEETRLADFVSLQLRLREGLSRSQFQCRFGRSIDDVLGAELRALQSDGVLEEEGDRLRVTRDWVFVTNEVLARLLAGIE
ncbi:MAG TPA: radical SAM family heme chaperone HemW [Chloroflexota bacterium]|nr:radical SAM family heme chaperone HemW [Chloroflexota bacterium]